MEGRNHILFISSWYPNRNNPTHGIFNKAFARAAALHNKVSVLHVCSDEQLSSDFEIEETLEDSIHTVIVYYKKIQTRLPLIAQLLKRKQLLKGMEMGYRQLITKTGTPQLIQLNVVMPAGIGVLALSEKYRLPYIINEGWSGYCPEDGNYKGLLMTWLTKKIVAKARMIMPVSEHLQKAMLAHGLQGNYTIVPNVVDTDLFVPQVQPAHAATRFIHISTLDDSQKNVSGIIRAFSAALKTNTSLELLIVGEGADRPHLEALVQQLNTSPRIRFAGRLMGQELVAAIHQSDALVMFSNYETFCLTVAEALACGKPVITSRAGGLTDHISPELGIMIDKKDEQALADALINFKDLQAQFDPAAMRHFITSRFTLEKIGAQLTNIYTSVIQNKST